MFVGDSCISLSISCFSHWFLLAEKSTSSNDSSYFWMILCKGFSNFHEFSCNMLWLTLVHIIFDDHTGSSWARIRLSWPICKNYHGFVGTSVRDEIDAVFSIGNIEWSFVSERVSRRFGMSNISKEFAGVSFGRNNLLTLHFLVCNKNWKICLMRDLKFSKRLPFYVLCFFVSYWIGCNHLLLLKARLLHIDAVPQDKDQ